jgi:transcriptional regulator with XRE-family HTH domain
MTPEQRRALGRTIAVERDRLGLTQRQLASRVLNALAGPQKPDLDTVDGYIKRWEAGRAGVGGRYRRALAIALDTDPATLYGITSAAPPKETDDERRQLLACLAALGIESTFTHEPLEPIRRALMRALPGGLPRQLIADWEEIAFEYSQAFLTTPPQVLKPALAHDLVRLQQLLRGSNEASVRQDLYGPAGKLAALLAMTVASLGEDRQARDWWKTARHTADASDDRALQIWIRGHEAMSALYSVRPVQLVLRLADEAIAIAGDRKDAAVMEAMASRAQALAILDRAEEAEAALHAMQDRFARLPQTPATERLSIGAWPETAMRHTAAFTYTCIGNTAEAEREQTGALALYPDTMPRQRAQIELLRATCLIQAGDLTTGVEHASATVEALSPSQRTTTIRRGAHMVLQAIPEASQKNASVGAFREVIALPAATS